MVLNRGVNPPWVPRIRNLVDTQYFDRYAESQESHTMPTDEQQRHFTDFWYEANKDDSFANEFFVIETQSKPDRW